MLRFLVFTLFMKECFGVIYKLNESEYSRMPALFSLDDYAECLLEPGGTYCLVDMDLFSETPSSLMIMIQEYSEYKMKHYNHSQIHRGVCVTKTCKNFIANTTNKTEDLNATLEGCLNHTLWRDYEIQGKLANVVYCKTGERIVNIDFSDIIVAVIYLVLIVVNSVGSFYDILICRKDDKKTGNPYLLAFSLPRNWAKMTAPSGVGPEPRLERLKLFHGLRTMTIICVIFSHTVLMMSFSYVDNPLYIETAYDDPLKQIIFNGSLVTHTFFVMSSFLLAYNFQMHAEKHSVRWTQWPKGILLRWIRLTPAYALIVATTCTWMRHLSDGPLWELVVGSEARACRSYWWAHLLYINNYLYDDPWCAPQTWYLAADTQLFCLGLLVCMLARGARAQKLALITLFVMSLVISAAHTYFQDLDAVVIQSPEVYRSLYASDDTFRLLYIRGHTNLSTYTLGLAGGFLAYYCQTEEKEMEWLKKFRWAFWLLFPLGVAVILSGGLFYVDGWSPGTVIRVLYATLYKPVFQLLVVLFILGCIFKVDTVYRGIVEWRGFTWMGRVSYSAFLVHTMFQRGFSGIQTAPTHMSDYHAMMILAGSLFLTLLGASGLWLLVEAPVAALVKPTTAPRTTQQTKV